VEIVLELLTMLIMKSCWTINVLILIYSLDKLNCFLIFVQIPGGPVKILDEPVW